MARSVACEGLIPRLSAERSTATSRPARCKKRQTDETAAQSSKSSQDTRTSRVSLHSLYRKQRNSKHDKHRQQVWAALHYLAGPAQDEGSCCSSMRCNSSHCDVFSRCVHTKSCSRPAAGPALNCCTSSHQLQFTIVRIDVDSIQCVCKRGMSAQLLLVSHHFVVHLPYPSSSAAPSQDAYCKS
jgi:hypothetical protein